jgi:hypothetical protein
MSTQLSEAQSIKSIMEASVMKSTLVFAPVTLKESFSLERA